MAILAFLGYWLIGLIFEYRILFTKYDSEEVTQAQNEFKALFNYPFPISLVGPSVFIVLSVIWPAHLLIGYFTKDE